MSSLKGKKLSARTAEAAEEDAARSCPPTGPQLGQETLAEARFRSETRECLGEWSQAHGRVDPD